MRGAPTWQPDACCVVAGGVLSVTSHGRQSELGPQDGPVQPDGGEASGPDLAWEKGAEALRVRGPWTRPGQRHPQGLGSCSVRSLSPTPDLPNSNLHLNKIPS